MDNDLAARIAVARQELAALEAQVATHEVSSGTSDTGGFWQTRLPRKAAPDTEADRVDEISGLSYEEYAAWRATQGLAGRGIENLSRRPGVTSASSSDSGFPDWSDRSAGARVFESTLNRNRGKEVPVGYQRPAATEENWS